MPQRRVFGDASEFPFYDLRDVLLDLRIIASDDLLHTIHAVGIAERGYFRDRNVRSRLPCELLPVDEDLGVEDLLFDAFVEVVCHGTHEHALREVGDLRGGNQAVELRIGRGGEVVVTQRVGGPQLHDPAEALAQRLGRISQNLTCEDVAHGILDDLGFLLAVVAFELREVLKAQAYGHLVRAGRGDQVVQPPEIDRGQLVDDDRRLEFSFLVDEPHDARIIEAQRCRVDVLPVGIVAHAQNLRVFGVVDVQRKVVARHHPVELRGDHAREGYLGRSDLPLQLVLRPAFPRIHKGRQVIFQFGIGGQDREDVLVAFAQQFDGVGKGAVLSSFVDFQVPDNRRQQDDR